MSLEQSGYNPDNKTELYSIGDIVCIESNNKIISCTIIDESKWKNWTDDGQYDYLYPVKTEDNKKIYICQKRILKKIGSDRSYLSELKSNNDSAS